MAAGSEASPNRMPWHALPAALRERVEARAGARVVRSGLAAGGFSAGYAGVLEFEGGARVFVKAGDGATNPQTAELHLREAAIGAALPRDVAPALEWALRWDDWIVLAFAPIDGRHPGAPWTPADLDAVLRAQSRIAQHDAPAGLAPLGPRIAEQFTGWSLIRAEGALPSIPAWARARLDEFVSWEGVDVAAAAAGDALVHLDMRSDNMLIDRDRVWFVDWPHAGVGAPWLDVAFFAPTVPLESGPTAAEVFARSPASVGVDPHHLRAVVSGWAGWLLRMSTQPDPPGIPHLRAFQAAQARTTLDWLRTLIG